LPIIKWADIATMLDADNAGLKSKAVHLESFAPSSANAKFLQVPDDSMAPEFAPGDHVLVDPAEAPHASDVVLVRLPSNEHFLRYFRPRTAYVFDAVPGNQNYLALKSTDDGVIVVGVMVEHRRYRR
jgi:SOS-response transcriptional repressor LexA